MIRTKAKGYIYGIALSVLILVLMAANLWFGSINIPAGAVWNTLIGNEVEKTSWAFIIWESRLPQAVTALLCGAALAASGLMLQTAFNNPLAGPSILGINSGASLGVALVMLAGGGSIATGVFTLSGFFSVILGAFIGSMVVMGLILFFSTLIKSNIMLLITGIMIGYITSSAISLLNFFATAEGVHSYMIWGMGNFGGVSLQQLPYFSIFCLAGLLLSILLIKPLNALLLELWRHLGPDMDVPAGDIGVGGREVGYMFGMYKKLTREFTGTFTGKGLEFGGSLIRPEATGFGGLYFVNQMLETKGIDIKGKTVAISGFGNVAWGAATKATQLGAKVITISGPDGYIYDPNGISGKKIDYMLELRASGNDIVAPYADEFPGSTFVPGKRPWEVKADIALPCATQNELNGEDAQHLIDNKVTCVGEISNMGCTPEAIDLFIENKIMYAPGKAVNAGGVATSGLEMSQNAMHLSWSAAEVDEKLHAIMHGIHAQCVKYGTEPDGYINYVKGANIAGFMKVAHAMMGQGII